MDKTGEKRRRRVVVYKDNVTTGRGADRAVCDVCGFLCGSCAVVLLTQGEGAVSYPLDARVRIERMPAADPRSSLRTTMARLRPDLVIAAGVNEILDLHRAFPGSDRAALSGFPWPTVLQFHVYPPFVFKRKRWIRNFFLRRAIRRCDAVQVLLPPFEADVRRLTGFRGPICVIANAVAPSGGKGREPSAAAAVPSPRVIVYPAAVNAQKRQELLIRALAEMRATDVRVELFGAGKPAYVSRLRALARRLGVGDRVSFNGHVADLASAYARAAVVAFPSAAEGFGMVIPEAAACGKRVVACRDCAASAALVPPFDGILTDPDPRAYAAGLEAALANRDPVPRAPLSAFAPEVVSERWRRLVEAIVYSEKHSSGEVL